MKKIFTLAICAISLQIAVAQSFEGYFKSKIEVKMGGQSKATLSEADKAKTQAGLAQMKAQLNDPNIQNNPQAKAQIEKAIQMMEMMSAGGGNTDNMMASVMPKSITVKVKNGNRSMNMEGGMMAGRTITLKGSTDAIFINDKDKTFSKKPTKTDGADDNFKVEKTSETAKILGYTCTKYIVTGVDKRSKKPTTVFFWTTTEIAGIDYNELYKSAGGQSQSFYYKGITGVPLKIETKMDEGSFTFETIELKQTSIPDSEFTIPAGYKESKSPY